MTTRVVIMGSDAGALDLHDVVYAVNVVEPTWEPTISLVDNAVFPCCFLDCYHCQAK